MSTSAAATPSTAELLAEFRPLFAKIASGAVARERERILPFQQVAWLREAKFTQVSVPREFGGKGANLGQTFRLLIELAEADSNLTQLLRAHFAVVERLQLAPSALHAKLLAEAAAGKIFGNASHERSEAQVGALSTVAQQSADGTWTLNGRKAYSTGSLFADRVFVTAVTDAGVRQFAVPADASGLELIDDWDGFGQRLTGSGSTLLTNVILDEDSALESRLSQRTHLTAFVLLVLLSTLAGIGRAAVRDGVAFVRTRTRVYSHGSAPTAAEDPLVHQVLGRASALAFAAESSVLAAVERLQAVHDAVVSDSATQDTLDALIDQGELSAVRAQLAVSDLVLQATTLIFEVGGASATSASLQLDRHWRNARTVSSHNPAIYQARVIGNHLVNQAPLQYYWQTGESHAGDATNHDPQT